MQEYGKANRRRNLVVNLAQDEVDNFDMQSHGGRNRKFKDETEDFHDGKSFLSLDDAKLAKVGINSIQPSSVKYKSNRP
jgi:hypothetical protein